MVGWTPARRAVHGAVAVASLAILAAALVVSRVIDVPFATISRDMFITAEVPTSTGLLSNIGVVIWSGAGFISLFAASVVLATGRDRRLVSVLGWGGALSGLLAADDLFVLHEHGYAIDLPERGIIGAYFLALLAFLFLHRAELLNHPALAPNAILLVVALAFFAGSMMVDLLQEPIDSLIGGRRIFLEDGCKFLGIAWWSAYFVNCAFDALVGPARSLSPATP